jgi:hypothetical protein
MRETLTARGHRNITARHRSTMEITRETKLSKAGDCVIAVGSNKGLPDLSDRFLKRIRRDGARIKMCLRVGDLVETIRGFGSSELVLSHPNDLVVRKSKYVCDRTLMICADKVAADLSRELVSQLANPNNVVKIIMEA